MTTPGNGQAGKSHWLGEKIDRECASCADVAVQVRK